MKQKREMKKWFAMIAGVLVFAAMPVLVFAEGDRLAKEPDFVLEEEEPKPSDPSKLISGENTYLLPGDIDWNWEVNAVDAYWVLQYAAYTGAGKENFEDSFSREERNAYFNGSRPDVAGGRCDINRDGVTDATDASLILQYAAAVGAGYDEDIEWWYIKEVEPVYGTGLVLDSDEEEYIPFIRRGKP